VVLVNSCGWSVPKGTLPTSFFRISLPQGNYAATDLVAAQPVACRYQDGRLVLSKVLEPGEIWVVQVRG
jgi:hypothetical protein